ncbi:hypothetical protein KC19_7G151000 [Ceratodon purpureus]|uniref:RING-CH-type domain-containing protein n=1 Tax=Ceratodon purpureus TaxID=3225 RepID=A0A8T0HBD8_CERPU|nr:hypothetical protein KC19_7G151000 [Ceratodon purpureus]
MAKMESTIEFSNDVNSSCRICWEAQTNDEDPILQLGCDCKSPLDQAHSKCIYKWFSRPTLGCHPLRYGQIIYNYCEICQTDLSPPILLLLQNELNRNIVRARERRNQVSARLLIQRQLEEVVVDIPQQNEAVIETESMFNCSSLIFLIILLVSIFIIVANTVRPHDH